MFSIIKVNAHPTVDFAAEELKKYLRMMMPRCGEVPITFDPQAADAAGGHVDARDSFRLGLMSDFGLDTSDAQDVLLDDIIYVDTDAQGGVIAGSNPGALLIAVYRFLRFCGCRWLFPGIDGEKIPVIDGLKSVKYRKMADYRYRGQCNEGAESQQCMIETIDFSPKIGFNTYMLEFDVPFCYYDRYYNHNMNTVREPENVTAETVLQWKRQCEVEIQKRGMHYHDMGHGWTAEPFGLCSVGGWKKLVEHVPPQTQQYIAQVNGVRDLFKGVPLNTNICLSNAEARQILVRGVADYAEKQNNVDFLHIWMADATSNHCECDECAKKTVPDWYVILLNEIDAELTRRGLQTKLVFICYTETFWAPLTERLNNPERFTMLYAPIFRLYTETYGEEADEDAVVPYVRNTTEYPHGMAASLGYLKKWQKVWPGDTFCYEYHFWKHQYYDPSGMYLGKLLYEDIRNLKKNDLRGIVEDGSQRSFFPTGFPFYVYGEMLFDAGRTYDELVEDYFSNAFGKDWRAVVDYLNALRDHMNFAYLSGLRGTEEHPYHDLEVAKEAAAVEQIVADFAPVITAHKNDASRAVLVSWRLLEQHQDFVLGLARAMVCKASGDDQAAAAEFTALKEDFSRREIYIERWYDHMLAMSKLGVIFK